MTSLLRRLPRKSANTRILRLHKCFQKGSVFIRKGTTAQNVFMYLTQGEHQIPNWAVGVRGTVWLEGSSMTHPFLTMVCGLQPKLLG